MKLKEVRERSGKSQQVVAVENGLAVSGYRRIESGDVQKPGITSVYGISRSIGADPHDIDEFAATLNEYATAIGFSDRDPVTAQQGGGVEHFYSKQRFQAAVRTEVERRFTVAQQSGLMHTTAQSNESNAT